MQRLYRDGNMITCIIKRAFFLNGKTVKPGSTVDLPELLAWEMKTAQKVDFSAPEVVEITIDPAEDESGLTAADVPKKSAGRPRGRK